MSWRGLTRAFLAFAAAAVLAVGVSLPAQAADVYKALPGQEFQLIFGDCNDPVVATIDGVKTTGQGPNLTVKAPVKLGEYPVTGSCLRYGETQEYDFGILKVVQFPIPDGAVQGQISPKPAHPGDVITVKGSGFTPGETVKVNLYLSGELNHTWTASTVADAKGNVDYSALLPRDIPTGQFAMVLEGTVSKHAAYDLFDIVAGQGNGGSQQQSPFRNTSASKAAPTRTLAKTGTDPVPPAILGLGAIFVGVGMVAFGKHEAW